jgi:hypothetical protein
MYVPRKMFLVPQLSNFHGPGTAEISGPYWEGRLLHRTGLPKKSSGSRVHLRELSPTR